MLGSTVQTILAESINLICVFCDRLGLKGILFMGSEYTPTTKLSQIYFPNQESKFMNPFSAVGQEATW